MESVDVSYANGPYQPGAEDQVICNASRANIGLAVGSFYHQQVDAARAAGKHVGHYFFNGNLDPIVCARFFVANLHDYRHGDLLAIDCEYEGPTGTVAWNPGQALAFLAEVVALTGASWSSTAVYINRSIRGQWDWSPLWSRGVKKWIASPGADPGDWDIWQYSSAGGVDRNHVKDSALAGFNVTPLEGFLMALTDAEQAHLLQRTDAIYDALFKNAPIAIEGRTPLPGGVLVNQSIERDALFQDTANGAARDGLLVGLNKILARDVSASLPVDFTPVLTAIGNIQPGSTDLTPVLAAVQALEAKLSALTLKVQ